MVPACKPHRRGGLLSSSSPRRSPSRRDRQSLSRALKGGVSTLQAHLLQEDAHSLGIPRRVGRSRLADLDQCAFRHRNVCGNLVFRQEASAQGPNLLVSPPLACPAEASQLGADGKMRQRAKLTGRTLPTTTAN